MFVEVSNAFLFRMVGRVVGVVVVVVVVEYLLRVLEHAERVVLERADADVDGACSMGGAHFIWGRNDVDGLIGDYQKK